MSPATSPASAPATGFAITVPDSWFEVDVHPDTRNGSINDLVTRQLRAVPELREHRAALVRALRTAARGAHSAGAVYCGTMVQGLDSAVITATVTVSLIEAPNEENASEAILANLLAIPRSGPDETWREVVSVELPGAGRVPRTRGVEDVVLPEGAGWIRCVLMQTFVPVPGPKARVALITGSSPILQLTDQLLDLFDAVSSTFRFTAEPGPVKPR
jgi:hypothetical protein